MIRRPPRSTLFLHDALPISSRVARRGRPAPARQQIGRDRDEAVLRELLRRLPDRSEEHTSELQSLAYLVCRLLLEKKKPKSAAQLESDQLPTIHGYNAESQH